MWFDWIYDLLTKPYMPPIPPPQAIRKGKKINGRLFPKNTVGFVRFNYNEAFADVPWNETRSHWKGDQIIWDAGKINILGQIKPRIVKKRRGDINRYWLDLGYLPGYWRITTIHIPEDQPIGLASDDYFPKAKIAIPKYTYRLIFAGEVSLYEFCQVIPSCYSSLRHEIYVNPIRSSWMARYYASEDAIIPYVYENGKWTI